MFCPCMWLPVPTGEHALLYPFCLHRGVTSIIDFISVILYPALHFNLEFLSLQNCHNHLCSLSVFDSYFFIILHSIDSFSSSTANMATGALTAWQRATGSAVSARRGVLHHLLSLREWRSNPLTEKEKKKRWLNLPFSPENRIETSANL